MITEEEQLPIHRVSKHLNIPTGTLRQWEIDFLLKIERDAYTGSRRYSTKDIFILKTIKSYRDKNISKKCILDLLIKDGLITKPIKSVNSKGDFMTNSFSFKELLNELSKPERLTQVSDEEFEIFLSLIKNIEAIRRSNNEIKSLLTSLTD